MQRMVRAPYPCGEVSWFSHLMTQVVVVAAVSGLVQALIEGQKDVAGWAFMALVGWLYVLRWEAAARRSNDPKLSDGGGWRGPCMVGGKAAAEARAVTAGAVRCSAWLGVSGFMGFVLVRVNLESG